MIPLTPERLAAVYECLKAFPPYDKLGLPGAKWVKFSVLRTRRVHGDYYRYKGTQEHFIRISAPMHAHLDSVAATLGHEMFHLAQAIRKTETRGEHNAEFRRYAKRACRVFGWDLGQF